MLKKRLPVVLAVAAALVVSTAPAVTAAPPAHATDHVKVVTYNVFLGGDIGALLTAQDFATAAAAFWAEVQANDFPARATALADTIAKEQPDLVGLQEVARWETTLLGSSTAGPTVDYLTILLAALAAEGTPYKAVVTNENVATPMIPLVSQGVGVEYTDRDVLLARADLPESQLSIGDTAAFTFAARIPFPLPPLGPGAPATLDVVRGWSEAEVQLRGKDYRVVNTHLEAFSPAVRYAQATELAAALGDSVEPIILTGDLNDDPGVGAVQVLMEALDLSDSWTKRRPGYTAGQDDLTTAVPAFDRRIDYVLYEEDETPDLRSLTARVIGEEPSDRTAPLAPSGIRLWPSDHAGVVAMLQARTP